MVIYGVGILAACMLVGMFVGQLLGMLVGIKADVGGVGFAMLLLIFVSSYLDSKGHLPAKTQSGVAFWSAMYVPIVIAMSAKQNVLGAIAASHVALIAGVGAVLISLVCVPILSRIGGQSEPLPKLED